MSNQLALIESTILSCRDSFTTRTVDRSISFEREAGFAMQHMAANDYLMKTAVAQPQSVIDAVNNVASIGISLNPAKKQAYLVPRKVGSGESAGTKVCLDISYMGLADLAVVNGAITWVQAAIVYEQDNFVLNGIDKAPTHSFNPFKADRGLPVGAFCVVKLRDGDFLTHTMDTASINEIRDKTDSWKAYKDKKIKSCPWLNHWAEMAKKTCVKQGSKYWPEKSERLQHAIEYMNTEGGEGIELAPQVPPPPPPADNHQGAGRMVWPQEAFDKRLPAWTEAIHKGIRTHDQVIAFARSKGDLTQAQEHAIRSISVQQQGASK